MKKIVYLLLVSLILSVFTGCTFSSSIGQEELKDMNDFINLVQDIDFDEIEGSAEDHRTLENQEKFALETNLSYGDLNVKASEDDSLLYQVNAKYNYDKLEPSFKYRDGVQSEFQIRHQKNLTKIPSGVASQIDAYLNPSILTAANLKLGMGDVNVDASGLNISNFDVDLGMGNFSFLAKGDYANFNSLNAKCAMGNADIIIDGSLEEAMDLDIECSMGNISVELIGDLKKGGRIDIKAAMGDTDILIPSNIGVKINIEGINNGKVIDQGKSMNIKDLKGSYTNSLYDEANPHIEIDIAHGIGDINIELTDEKKEADVSVDVDKLISLIYSNDLDTIKDLSKKNYDFNVFNSEGVSPLEAAYNMSYCPMVKLLLESGANPHIKTSDGENLYDKATSSDSSKYMRDLFEEYK